MNINQLIEIVKNKLSKNIVCENIEVQDKTYLHEGHKSHDKNKFHLKLTISSKELKTISKLEATKKIHKILQDEINNYIHSIQILFN